MTPRAVVGLVVLNLFVLCVGAGLLWGIRGWRSWTEFLRLAGLAYLLGTAGLFVLLMLELVVGVPFEALTIVATGVVLAGAGLAFGRVRGRVRPQPLAPNWHVPRPSILVSLFVAAIVLYFEALFRSGRLEGPGQDWDAWRAWTLRAKAIFYYGRLDVELPSLGPTPSYPPGLSALHAAAFHAMGSADVVTLHLQSWFTAVAFVAAVAGLLAARVRALILVPALLLALVMPGGLPEWANRLMADLLMGFFIAVAALLVVLWLEKGNSWHLAAATLLLAGTLLTKREGLLLVACVVVAAFAASWGERRHRWPRLAGSAMVAFALALPWRIWFMAQELPSDAPEKGYLGSIEDPERAWPSLELVLRTLFDYDLWLALPVVALAGAVLAFVTGCRTVSIFVGTFAGVSVLGSTWVIWSNPSLEITQDNGVNPIVRLMSSTAFVLAALTPLVLERAWSGARELAPISTRPLVVGARRAAIGWAIIVISLLGYPASLLAGTSAFRLPGGAPPFPSPDECVETPVEDAEVRVVFGYEESYVDAFVLRDRALTAGFKDTAVAQDGCGRLRVFVGNLPSIEAGEQVAANARAKQLEAALERDT